MMYKCLDCGRIFEDSEFAEWIEPHGEIMIGCPCCKSEDCEEAVECLICGEIHPCSELVEDVCEKCISDYRYDHEMCFKVGAHEKESVSLNSFITQMFDADEIEDVMFKHLKEMGFIFGRKIDCSKFILSDKHFFAENLVEEVNK